MTKIICDSTCDLSESLLHKYDISILPLHILLDTEEYEDGVNLKPEEIYKWANAHKTTPKTSAPSLAQAIALFEPYVKSKTELVCFPISSEMSASADVMRQAARELDAQEQITVIDSRNLSTGIGLLAVEAAILAAKGADAKNIAEKMEELVPKVRASFVVDTLTYLHRGGRCSGLAAFAGGALKIHPKIEVLGGTMKPGNKYRGNMDRVILHYAKDLEAQLLSAKPDRVFITHSGCDAGIVKKVYAYLDGLHYFNEIIETRAGGVISSHCGPGTLGILFIGA